ncbi:glycosyltransferase [bacterium]|nr:glycosyltransferase [bacterium]
MKETVIIISNIDWNFNYQRHQALAEILSDSYNVIFINPYKTFAGKWRFPGVKISDNEILVVDCFPLIPFENRVFFIKQFNRGIVSILLNSLAFLINLLTAKKPSLYEFLPRGIHFKKGLFNIVFSDMIDRLPETFHNLDEQEEYDLKIMEIAEHSIITCNGLLKSSTEINAVTIPNGIFTEKYHSVFKYNCLKWKMEGYKIRNIGYVGGTHELDFDLIRILAMKLESCNFIIVGPIDKDPGRLPKNVILTGKVSHEEILRYMKCFDAGIVPFLVNRVTQMVDAIKIYEYFASGIPVIATPYNKELPEELFLLENTEQITGIIQKIENMNKNLVITRTIKEKSNNSDWHLRFSFVLNQLR